MSLSLMALVATGALNCAQSIEAAAPPTNSQQQAISFWRDHVLGEAHIVEQTPQFVKLRNSDRHGLSIDSTVQRVEWENDSVRLLGSLRALDFVMKRIDVAEDEGFGRSNKTVLNWYRIANSILKSKFTSLDSMEKFLESSCDRLYWSRKTKAIAVKRER